MSLFDFLQNNAHEQLCAQHSVVYTILAHFVLVNIFGRVRSSVEHFPRFRFSLEKLPLSFYRCYTLVPPVRLLGPEVDMVSDGGGPAAAAAAAPAAAAAVGAGGGGGGFWAWLAGGGEAASSGTEGGGGGFLGKTADTCSWGSRNKDGKV